MADAKIDNKLWSSFCTLFYRNRTQRLSSRRSSPSSSMARCVASSPSTSAVAISAHLRHWKLREWGRVRGVALATGLPLTAPSPLLHLRRRNSKSTNNLKRTTLICAVNQDAEQSFQKTLEVDRLIDKLRVANPKELDQVVVENIFSFDEGFWVRLAARADTCKSEDDKRDYEELASTVMNVVDRLVHKTKDKIESSTDVLKAILRPVAGENEEILWPPKDPMSLVQMERELCQREQEGKLDEGFLSEVNAQLRQARKDGDKPGLEAMLQKVLQLYASKILSGRSYALKGGKVLKDESFLESLIKAPSENWARMLLEGLTLGKGDISAEELYAVIKKRTERTLIRTEGGSYQQRILTEYLRGIQTTAEEIVQALQGKQP